MDKQKNNFEYFRFISIGFIIASIGIALAVLGAVLSKQ